MFLSRIDRQYGTLHFGFLVAMPFVYLTASRLVMPYSLPKRTCDHVPIIKCRISPYLQPRPMKHHEISTFLSTFIHISFPIHTSKPHKHSTNTSGLDFSLCVFLPSSPPSSSAPLILWPYPPPDSELGKRPFVPALGASLNAAPSISWVPLAYNALRVRCPCLYLIPSIPQAGKN